MCTGKTNNKTTTLNAGVLRSAVKLPDFMAVVIEHFVTCYMPIGKYLKGFITGKCLAFSPPQY